MSIKTNFKKNIISLLIFVFFIQTALPAYSIEAFNLPQPGTMVTLSQGYVPPLVYGINIHPENPLQLDFFIHHGEQKISAEDLENESRKLIKYFLTSLTIPEKDLWVNLSPYEENRIIQSDFGVTEMGKDMLAQDYLLKQLTASLINPEDKLGEEFWDKVHEQAYEKYGTTDIPIDTFNKVWIVPDEAVVYESGNNAFVLKSHLKVMLDVDYAALQKNKEVEDSLASDVIRQIIIPEIEKEVNEGKHFAPLRQIFYSMILAVWYKKKLKDSLLGQVYVDKSKIKGVDIEDKKMKDKIYKQYLEAFKKGVYDYVKEDFDPLTQQIIPRKYFSGGVTTNLEDTIEIVDNAMLTSRRSMFRDMMKIFNDKFTEGKNSVVNVELGQSKQEADRFFDKKRRKVLSALTVIFGYMLFPTARFSRANAADISYSDLNKAIINLHKFNIGQNESMSDAFDALAIIISELKIKGKTLRKIDIDRSIEILLETLWITQKDYDYLKITNSIRQFLKDRALIPVIFNSLIKQIPEYLGRMATSDFQYEDFIEIINNAAKFISKSEIMNYMPGLIEALKESSGYFEKGKEDEKILINNLCNIFSGWFSNLQKIDQKKIITQLFKLREPQIRVLDDIYNSRDVNYISFISQAIQYRINNIIYSQVSIDTLSKVLFHHQFKFTSSDIIQGPGSLWSIAMATAQNLENSQLPLNDENISVVLHNTINTLKRDLQEEVNSTGGNSIFLTHAIQTEPLTKRDYFDNSEMIDLVRKVTKNEPLEIRGENNFHTDNKKIENFLKTVANGKGKVQIHMSLHGEVDNVSISNFANFFVQQFAASLVQRIRNNESLKDVSIVFDQCFGFNFAKNLGIYLYQLISMSPDVQKNVQKLLGLKIFTIGNDYDVVPLDHNFVKSVKEQLDKDTDKTSLKFKHYFYAQDNIEFFKKIDSGFFVITEQSIDNYISLQNSRIKKSISAFPFFVTGGIELARKFEKNVTPHQEKKRILVVDDKDSMSLTMKWALEDNGYEVDSAENAEDALEKIEEEPDKYDLVISDYQMGEGMLGDEFASIVRDRYNKKVMMMTASGLNEKDLGVNIVLQKPFEEESLIAAVHEVLQDNAMLGQQMRDDLFNFGIALAVIDQLFNNLLTHNEKQEIISIYNLYKESPEKYQDRLRNILLMWESFFRLDNKTYLMYEEIKKNLNVEQTERVTRSLNKIKNINFPVNLYTISKRMIEDVIIMVSPDAPTYGEVSWDPQLGLRPIIFLNSKISENLTDEEITWVLGHELGHIILYNVHKFIFEENMSNDVDRKFEVSDYSAEIEKVSDMFGVVALRSIFPQITREELLKVAGVIDNILEYKPDISILVEYFGIEKNSIPIHMRPEERRIFIDSLLSYEDPVSLYYDLMQKVQENKYYSSFEKSFGLENSVQDAVRNDNNQPVGGIDFNPGNFNLQIKRDTQGNPLPLQFQDIPNINIDGLYPVIVNITPVTKLPFNVEF